MPPDFVLRFIFQIIIMFEQISLSPCPHFEVYENIPNNETENGLPVLVQFLVSQILNKHKLFFGGKQFPPMSPSVGLCSTNLLKCEFPVNGYAI